VHCLLHSCPVETLQGKALCAQQRQTRRQRIFAQRICAAATLEAPARPTTKEPGQAPGKPGTQKPTVRPHPLTAPRFILLLPLFAPAC
jgi:hypothetical protein